MSKLDAVVRNGHLPNREIATGAGMLEVAQPRVRDRSPDVAGRVRISPSILPPYLRRSKSVNELRNGATLAEARELARRTDVRQTMKYTHIGIHDQAKALSGLPLPKVPEEATEGSCSGLAAERASLRVNPCQPVTMKRLRRMKKEN